MVGVVDDSTSDFSPEASKKSYNPWHELTRKQQKNRSNSLWIDLNKFAEKEGLEVEEVLSFLQTRTKPDVDDVDSATVLTATSIASIAGLGRRPYTEVRTLINSTGTEVLPSWGSVTQYKQTITPPLNPLPEPHSGIYAEFSLAVQMTLERIIQARSLNQEDLVVKMKYGFDGSGGHTIFKHSAVDTNNIIISMFCILEIWSSDKLIWSQDLPNSEFAQRPVMLQLGKESHEQLKSQSTFNEVIKKMEQEGLQLSNGVMAKISIVAFCMDRKASNLYLGCGGAYCDLCTCSKVSCHSISVVENGFLIDRTVNKMAQIFEDLFDEDLGLIEKRPNDYYVRCGQTNQPIPDHPVRPIQVLHCLLRCFDHFMKICLHMIAGILRWSESKFDVSCQFLEAAKKQLQELILTETGERWNFVDGTGNNGTSTNGNCARSLLHSPETRSLVCSLISNPRHREVLLEYGKRLSEIIKVVSSSNEVKVDEFKNFCTETNVFLLEHMPWVVVTPSLHKLLAHAWELIEVNDCHGLKSWSEEGIESVNKRLRLIRTRLSRKNNQLINLHDCFSRLWIGSDPLVAAERAKAKGLCSVCSLHGHRSRSCPTKVTNNDELSSYFFC